MNLLRMGLAEPVALMGLEPAVPAAPGTFFVALGLAAGGEGWAAMLGMRSGRSTACLICMRLRGILGGFGLADFVFDGLMTCMVMLERPMAISTSQCVGVPTKDTALCDFIFRWVDCRRRVEYPSILHE